MKRAVLNYIVIVVFAASAVFTSCDKNEEVEENGKIQLLRAITYGVGSYDKYEYDNQNRITKISKYRNYDNLSVDGELVHTETFTYIGSDFVKFVRDYGNGITPPTEFSKNGDKIYITDKNSEGKITATYTMDLDKNGYPTKVESLGVECSSHTVAYQIQSSNMTKYSGVGTSCSGYPDKWNYEYKYDNKKSPFYYCNTPRWCMFSLYYENGSKNNIIKASYSDGSIKYEYDRAGFPTKRTIKHPHFDESVSEYIYQ